MTPGTAFWQTMMELLTTNALVLDRPKGTAHPRYPDLIYPLDYGYLENTTAGDGDGIDVWLGSLNNKTLTGILCTFDRLKRDAEIKLMIACSTEALKCKPSSFEILWWKMTFPTDFLDLLEDETKALLYLATIMPDGSPQVTPVWFSTEGEHVLINTNEGRTKDKNMKARPRVAMTI